MPLSLLFTGHMVDLPGRASRRFPQDLARASEDWIGDTIAAADLSNPVVGFASLARGGDIIFHEQCRRRDIPTVVALPFSFETFLETSVRGVPGSDWESRSRALWTATPDEQREDLGLPVNDQAYVACNDYLLRRALAYGTLTAIALWDGASGEAGGTGDFASRVRRSAERLYVLSPASLSG